MHLEVERAADVLEAMDPDDAADLLGELPETEAESLLQLMDPQDSEPVRRLLEHSPDTAGGLMTPEPVVLTASTTVAEALARARISDVTPALASMVFVVRPPTATPTGRYLMIQTVVVIVWIIINVFAVRLQWDPYPFILLNLAFSTQAAYAAPLILLAQNRQENRDRVSLEEDRSRAEQTKADTEFLARELAALRIAIGEVATRDYLRRELDEIRTLLADEEDTRTRRK